MKLKITAIITAFVMLFALCVNAASFYDVDENTLVGTAVKRLSRLGILSGFADGSFHPDDILTRGQFAKIAVHMLGEEKNAASASGGLVFSDVPSSHWASGYVNYIAQKNIINGYPDGSFGVDEQITYAQVLTVLVRMLGYSGEDVGYRWPDGYITKAAALGITENVTFGKDECVTRANAAYLAYNTLIAEKNTSRSSVVISSSSSGSNSKNNSGNNSGNDSGNNSSSSSTTISSSVSLGGVSLISESSKSEVIIYSDWTTNTNLATETILTSAGVGKLAENAAVSREDYGITGTLYLDSEGKVFAFLPERETKKAVTLLNATKNGDTGKIELTYKDEAGNSINETLETNKTVYFDGAVSTADALFSEMESGRSATFVYGENGVLARIMLDKSSMQGPFTITEDYRQVFSFTGLSENAGVTVYRDGKKAAVSDILMYDVVYYSPGINTVYAYDEKITGTYEKAYPIKSNVTSVKVSGNEYELATQKAINKMNESDGAFSIGDRVTLLIGRTGKVVDVVDLNAGGKLDIAVLVDCYNEISEEADRKGERVYYVSVVLPDGEEVLYEADDDYSDYVGSVMKINYSNGIVKLNYVKPYVVSGEFDASKPSLGGHWLTDDCKILELKADPGTGKAMVEKVELHEIQLAKLGSNQVLHAEVSGVMSDITFLYVRDVTKSASEFGVITASMGKNRYEVLTGNSKRNITTSLKLTVGDAIEMQTASDGELSVKAMTKIDSAESVDAYVTGRIRVNSKMYSVAENVKIYGGFTADKFASMSESEMLDNSKVQKVTLYSDKSEKSGGSVRVIIVKTTEY